MSDHWEHTDICLGCKADTVEERSATRAWAQAVWQHHLTVANQYWRCPLWWVLSDLRVHSWRCCLVPGVTPRTPQGAHARLAALIAACSAAALLAQSKTLVHLSSWLA
jgi:hypothetical protein